MLVESKALNRNKFLDKITNSLKNKHQVEVLKSLSNTYILQPSNSTLGILTYRGQKANILSSNIKTKSLFSMKIIQWCSFAATH